MSDSVVSAQCFWRRHAVGYLRFFACGAMSGNITNKNKGDIIIFGDYLNVCGTGMFVMELRDYKPKLNTIYLPVPEVEVSDEPDDDVSDEAVSSFSLTLVGGV